MMIYNYIVSLRILWFFSSSFSRKIHHPCSPNFHKVVGKGHVSFLGGYAFLSTKASLMSTDNKAIHGGMR